jgi:hypothetical protein
MPASQSLATTVLVEPSPTLTIVHATANAASKQAVPAIRKCYEVGQTPCSEVTTLADVVQQGQATLPTGITRSTDDLTVAMTSNT